MGSMNAPQQKHGTYWALAKQGPSCYACDHSLLVGKVIWINYVVWGAALSRQACDNHSEAQLKEVQYRQFSTPEFFEEGLQ